MIKRQILKLPSLMLLEHGHRHWGFSSMAAFSSSSSYSSFVTGKKNPNPNLIASFPLARRSLSTTSFDSGIATTTANSFRPINWRGINGCRCSNDRENYNINSSKNVNIINISDNNDDVIISKANANLHKAHKAIAFPPSLPQLLCIHSEKAELEQNEEEGDDHEGKSVNNVTQNGANHRGSRSSIRFPSQPGKIVVAVDVDEVLGSFLSALNRFIAERYSSSHSISEYHVYEFFKIWNCSRDEADIRVHEFFKTSYFKKGIHPIPGARKTLENLSRFCNLSVVTSRQNAIKDQTIEWIENHYPGLFHEIHFGNHFALDGLSRPKSDICRSLGAEVLIDDNPRYAIECAEVGIRVLLFDYENSYPWSKTESVTKHPLVTKVRNWGEVEHRLVSRTFS